MRPGLLSVAGGKYTTYRVMAEDAVDAAVDAIGIVRAAVVHRRRSPGGRRRLRGHAQPRGTASPPSRASPSSAIDRLLGRYGSETPTAARPHLRPTGNWASPCPAPTTTSVPRSTSPSTHEGALHLDDVLTRRTRMSIETLDRGVAAAPVVGRHHGRAARVGRRHRRAREVDNYAKRVEAEIDSQRAADDRTADALRLGAEDVRIGLDG